jgi:hypothetical protein
MMLTKMLTIPPKMSAVANTGGPPALFQRLASELLARKSVIPNAAKPNGAGFAIERPFSISALPKRTSLGYKRKWYKKTRFQKGNTPKVFYRKT